MLPLIAVILQALTVAADNGITIPFSDDNKTLWELATDPFTRHIGGFFYVSIIMTVTAIIWMKTQSTVNAVTFLIISCAVMGALLPGDVFILFTIVTVVVVAVVFMRVLTARD